MSEQSWSVPIGEDDFDAFVSQLIRDEPLPSGLDPTTRLTEIRLAMAEAERLDATEVEDGQGEAGPDQAGFDEVAGIDDDARFADEPLDWADDPLPGPSWTDLGSVDDPGSIAPIDLGDAQPDIDDDPLG